MKELFGKLGDFFRSPSYSRTLLLIGLFILLLAIPVTVAFLGQQTQLKQSAYQDCSGDWIQCGGDSGYCSNLAQHKVHVYAQARCSSPVTCVDLGQTIGQCGYNPSNKCANGTGTCYVSNSCPAETHEVSGGGCATGYRFCCVPNPTPTPFTNTCLQTAGNKCAPANQGCDTLGAYAETTGACDIYHRSACCRPKSCGVGYTWDNSQRKCVATPCTAAGNSCYTNNSCAAGQHEVSQSCASTDNAGRICCAKGAVVCDTIGQVCCPGSVCSNGLYCDPMNVTCQAAKGYECANDGDRGAGKNEIVDGGTRISFTPKKYCPTNYFCTVNHNLITSHQASNGKWYSTSDTDICQPVYDSSHPYPGDTCASVNGPGVCLMATNSYPYYSTYRDATCLIPGPQVCNVRPVPDCAQYLPGTQTNTAKETQACPWNGGHDYKCCVYTSGITCSKIIAGGVCPIALTGTICPSGYHDSGASHPDSFCPIGGHSCCVPDSSGGGGGGKTCVSAGGHCQATHTTCTPDTTERNLDLDSTCGTSGSNEICCTPKSGGGGGGGGGCTKGKRTQFAVDIKLPGIGGGQFENHTPANPTKHGSLVVKDSNGVVKNGQEHDFSHSYGHENGNGKLKGEHVDLGSSKYVCGQTYHVEVKIPGYVTVKKDIVYGEDQTLNISENDIIPGDIVSAGTDNAVVNGKVIGDDKVTIADYNIFKACHENPNQVFTFTSNTTKVDLKCSDLINLFDFKDGGAGVDANGISEFADNYNLWLRGYIKANGY